MTAKILNQVLQSVGTQVERATLQLLSKTLDQVESVTQDLNQESRQLDAQLVQRELQILLRRF